VKIFAIPARGLDARFREHDGFDEFKRGISHVIPAQAGIREASWEQRTVCSKTSN
jgi:hypothetical protein